MRSCTDSTVIGDTKHPSKPASIVFYFVSSLINAEYANI